MKLLTTLLLSLALLLETTITTIPFVLLILLCLTAVYKENSLFIYAFVFGVFLDLILFKTVGASSLFFVFFLFLILIYQKKFEITTISFIFIASFLGSFGYLFFLGYNNVLLQAIISSFFGLILFKILQKNQSLKIEN